MPVVNIPEVSYPYNGLNMVPQMGWDNWNAFGCSVSESLLLNTAKKIVDLGLRDLGYEYIVLDDCWSSGRNSSGYLVADSAKFPSGMKYVADQIHSLGLKFGIYSSAGVMTCARYEGSLGNEWKDARLWASWGIDYLKYDNCFNQGQSGTPKISFDRYSVMSQALKSTGRPILYTLCNWGNDDPYDWAQTIANSGRMSGDISDTFNKPDARCPCTEAVGCPWPGFHCSVMNILNKMPAIQSRTMSGYFNDMDMLEVGNGGQSDSEYVVHFSMWAMNASPLLMGTNVETLSAADLAILSNPAIISINQDPSASAAVRKWRYFVDPDETGEGEISLWTRGLSNGDMIVALLNAGNTDRIMNTTLSEIFTGRRTTSTFLSPKEVQATWDLYDLWGNRMTNDEAAAIINGTATNWNNNTRYNATVKSYQDGTRDNDAALLGKHIGSISPSETLTAEVARHSVVMYRLRSQGSRMRDEL
ncbi:glycoside hydrolase [Lojkania enalia]|uniref:Alpha-galactosidase n=1 Tax=Lojkania enalia TaxID=147567 RepID=A0A9P4KBE2_9PLEO|nr:glycoside hydrolase [Didymosphaeria enalia]